LIESVKGRLSKKKVLFKPKYILRGYSEFLASNGLKLDGAPIAGTALGFLKIDLRLALKKRLHCD
jgi:hypothetical protein